MTNTFKNEGEVWKLFREPQGKKLRKELRDDFKKRFPKGHRESIRQLAEFCTDPNFQKHFGGNNGLKRMGSFHPRAFPLLLEYGQDYTTIKWKEPPKFTEEPRWAECFRNASSLMRSANHYSDNDSQEKFAYYVEGIANGGCNLPMLHAWNTYGLRDKKALDWSWYTNSHWYRYFGIPFTEDEHNQACLIVYPKGDTLISLLHKQHFSKIEHYLHEILARRKETRIQEKLLGT